ncbi:MAG: heparinase II/III family protein [Armatimonadota bacterium]|nr:heparinase II/III family protein [Armatimonadota bacterium]
MTRRALVITIVLLVLIIGFSTAQTVRSGGLENLALDAQVEASSSATDFDGKYGPPRAIDGSGDTRWASAHGAELPQWLQVTFERPTTVDTLVIEQSSLARIYANAERVELSFSEGETVEVALEDTSAPQIVRFEARETEWLRVTFLSVYQQKVYVGIDELQIFRDPDKVVQPVIPPRQRWEHPDLTAEGREVHPCVNKMPADVERARENMERYQWLAEYVENMQAQADEWLERSDEWILEMIPEPGACFAYGRTGCPICGASWGTWGGARCSWDNPGHVTCANGHVLPDEEHPDPGTGYVGEDGRIHYFVGSWNAWVVEKLQFDALRPLCLTYLFTGDERYAEKAAVIMDGIATIYPSCDKGSWDYPSDPPSGRLNRPWYQVARVLIHYVDFYDEIFDSPALDEPSLVDGLTRRENIEENLLRNGAWYCYEQSLKGGLHNGEADYIRGALAVGCVLGIDHYIDWALDGPYGIRSMIANNADRDGRYYETSLSYALHARNLYLTFSEPLLNYRSQKYPRGVNLYEDDKFLTFYFLPDSLFDCAGHMPRYGDTGPDTASSYPTDPIFSQRDYQFAEVCYRRTEGGARERFAGAMTYMAGPRGEQIRSSGRQSMWMLFHAGEFPGQAEVEFIRRRLTSTDFFGQKGIAILRAGEDTEAQAALLRFGQSLNHGHNDDLNLNYYALGYEVTYDLGYSFGSTHTQVGWARQTASHNLVVVDETPQHQAGCGSGGSLLLIDELPGLRVVEAEAKAAYLSQGVDRYRRLVALVGEGPQRYLIDLFRVRGGFQHDYMLHALNDELSIEGVEVGEPEPGSLAGPEYEWGKMQGNDGDMIGHPNKPYWNPPPGNGYGFLVDVRRGEADGQWTATWEIDPSREARVRAIGLPEPETELITAWAPGIYPRFPKAAYVCARRTGENLESTYATVLEPIDRAQARHGVRALEILSSAELTGGSMKYVSGIDVALFKAEAHGDRMTFPASVPEEGDYLVTVGHYLSPAYGTARLLIDGEPVGEPFRGTADGVAPARPAELGTVHVTAGQHEMAVELVAPDAEEGRYWMGLTFVGLQPADEATQGPVEPRIAGARRLQADREGAAGVHVVGRDGVEDRLFAALDARPADYGGGYAAAARLAWLRTDDRGPAQLGIIGGAELRAPHLSVRLARDAWRATVVEVDDDAGEVVLDVQGADLPEGEAVRGQAVYFSNPRYSRNTVYHVDSTRRDGGRFRLSVREATFLLGKAVIDGPPLDAHTLASLVPHDYARIRSRGQVPEEADFFADKLVTTEDGTASTTLRRVVYGQPQQLQVDSVEGFGDGDVCYYHDIRPGDEAVILAHASLTRTAGSDFALRTNVPLTLEGATHYRLQDADEWTAAPEGKIPAGAEAVRWPLPRQ